MKAKIGHNLEKMSDDPKAANDLMRHDVKNTGTFRYPVFSLNQSELIT